jgi:hypothetical protein
MIDERSGVRRRGGIGMSVLSPADEDGSTPHGSRMATGQGLGAEANTLDGAGQILRPEVAYGTAQLVRYTASPSGDVSRPYAPAHAGVRLGHRHFDASHNGVAA